MGYIPEVMDPQVLLAFEQAGISPADPKPVAAADVDLTAPLYGTWKEVADFDRLNYIREHLEELKARIIAAGHDFKKDPKKWDGKPYSVRPGRGTGRGAGPGGGALA